MHIYTCLYACMYNGFKEGSLSLRGLGLNQWFMVSHLLAALRPW